MAQNVFANLEKLILTAQTVDFLGIDSTVHTRLVHRLSHLTIRMQPIAKNLFTTQYLSTD